MPQALDEFQALYPSISTDEKALVYASALIAELAYYHITVEELDTKGKRARLIVPCEAFSDILKGRKTINVAAAIGIDDERLFFVSTRNTVAVAKIINGEVFIGYRGTRFFYDWTINLSINPVSANAFTRRPGPSTCYLHEGFAEEALRINVLVIEKLKRLGIYPPKKLYLTGHSLGGAVAAISAFVLQPVLGSAVTTIFGAPRYANMQHYITNIGISPLQIQRHGDIVPYVPPKSLGYLDHLNARKPDGKLVTNKYGDSLSFLMWRISKFVRHLASYHSIEKYRSDCAMAYGSANPRCPLLDQSKL